MLFTHALRRAGHTGLIALAATLAACGGGGSDDSSTETPSGTGTLTVRLTDSQSCDYKKVEVTITEVRVRQGNDMDDGDSGWITLPPSSRLPARVDLMSLRNGKYIDLGEWQLPAGDYSQVRLVLAENGGAAPWANQLTLTDDAVKALDTPSAQQSGLKVKFENLMTVVPAQAGVLVLDFDPCKSVVKAGRSGKYNLKPVMYAFLNPATDVVGYTVPGALVSAQQNGASVKSTTADANGRFVLWPVEVGQYDLVITAANRANAVLTDVQVLEGRNTVSAQGTPLVATAATIGTEGTVVGTVQVAGATDVYAYVRAIQTLGARSIEVGATTTATDGNYAFVLPILAPEQAAWVSGQMDYSFATVDASAGKYRIEAAVDSFPAQLSDLIELTSGDTIEASFSFPVGP